MGTYDDAPGGPNDPNGVSSAEELMRQQAEEDKRKADEAAAKAQAAAEVQRQKDAEAKINNHFNYGGSATGAYDASNFYRQEGRAAQGRAGEQIDYGRAHSYGEQAQGNAGAQGRVADLLWNRATGKTPSIAGMRADQDMTRLTAAQTSAAASARGPAALALAQQGAAANTSAGLSSISNTAQINSAQERSDAEKAAFNAYTGMRGQDFVGQGLEQDAAQKQAAMNQAARDANDRYSLGLYNNDVDINKAQLGAQGNQVGIASGAQTAANALAQQASQHGDDRTDKYVGIGVGAAAGIGGALLASQLGGGSKGANPAQGGVAGGGGDSGGNSDQYGEQGYSGSMEGYVPGQSDNGGGGYVPPDDIYSDERLKESMTREGAPTNRVDAFLDGIHPLSYNYKSAASEPRSTPTGGRYLGISAQDLEAVPEVGKQMVSEGPRGKQIESGPTLSAALAGLARLHERVKDIESGTAEQKAAYEAQGPAIGGGNSEADKEKMMEASRLQRSAGEIEAITAAQRSMLNHPSVGGSKPMTPHERQLLADAQGMMAGDQANLDAGPSVGSQPSLGRLHEAARDIQANTDAQRTMLGVPHGAHKRGVDMGYSRWDDTENLGPSGQGNRDEPEYNFVKTGSPNDVAEAFMADRDRNAVSPQTEAYMRREGLWGDNTDALLRDRGIRRGPSIADTFTSDIRAKGDVQSESGNASLAKAFRDGMNHANTAAETGTFGEVPDYARSAPPSNMKEQPPAAPRRAASMLEQRADRSQQSATNSRATRDLAVANIASLPVFGGSMSTGGALRLDEIANEQQMRANEKRRMRPVHVDPTSFTRENPPPMGDPDQVRVNLPTERRVGNPVYERETPDASPDWRKMINQAIGGRQSTDEPVPTSASLGSVYYGGR